MTNSQPKTAYIVDDEKHYRDIFKKGLKSSDRFKDYTIKEFDSVDEVLEHIGFDTRKKPSEMNDCELKNLPQLIVTDINTNSRHRGLVVPGLMKGSGVGVVLVSSESKFTVDDVLKRDNANYAQFVTKAQSSDITAKQIPQAASKSMKSAMLEKAGLNQKEGGKTL